MSRRAAVRGRRSSCCLAPPAAPAPWATSGLKSTATVFHGMFDDEERRYLESARVGRLATADAEGRPHVVPVCFALDGDGVVTAIDEKPKDVSPDRLRRIRDVAENPRVALVVDHYVEDWSRLGWLKVRGTATCLAPDATGHASAVAALRATYDQYADHALEERPVIRVTPGSVRSWGTLERPGAGEE